MGVIIDLLYFIREIIKLSFVVAISPPGLLAAYIYNW